MSELESQPQIPTDSELIHRSIACFDELKDVVLKRKKKRAVILITVDGDNAFCGCSGNEFLIAKAIADFLDEYERINLFFNREQFARGIEAIDEELENDDIAD